MNTSTHIAKHFRELYFGGNWTASHLKGQLAEVTWQEATTQVGTFNTLATLVYHIHYFVKVTLEVLEGSPLDAHDKFSFDHPPIHSQEDWQQFLDQVWAEGERFADWVAQLPEQQLWDTFSEEKYGNYYRNLQGIIEHGHYHLGQIVVLKKMISDTKD